MIEVISQDYAKVFLQQLHSLDISTFQKLSGDVGIHIGLGKTFSVDKDFFHNGTVSVKKKIITQYSLCIYGNVHICGVTSRKILLNENTTPLQIRQLRPILLKQKVCFVEISSRNQICITLKNCRIESSGNAEIYWSLRQPGTQEDELCANAEAIKLQRIVPRRWSSNQANNRDVWHSMSEIPIFRAEFESEKQIEHAYALSVVSKMKGAKLQYAIKSRDVNLFDCGFIGMRDIAFSLHISCAVRFLTDDGVAAVLYGDTPAEDYRLAFEPLIGSHVIEVNLCSGNVLSIRLENSNIEFIAAGDGEESWRFMTDEQHIVASNIAIWRE